MSFDQFENQARLYVLGALDASETSAFDEARRAFGARAEEFIQECRRLNAAFALSLHPRPPTMDAKQKLMALIQKSLRRSEAADHEEPEESHDMWGALETRPRW